MATEPKIIKILDENGDFSGYPITITKAVLDLEANKSLDELLEQFVNKQATIVKDSELQYHLEVGGQQSGSTIHTNNNWLESVSFDYNTRKFKFVFTTRQGKVTIYVGPEQLINQYYADEKTITLDNDTFKVKPNVFASYELGELANTALQQLTSNSNTEYLTLNTSEKNNGEQNISADIHFGSVSGGENGFALASDVKSYADGIRSYVDLIIPEAGCSFVVVDRTNYPDITSYFNNG